MFVGVFHNGLKVGLFNESLSQKPASSIGEIISLADCYIKGEESDTEKGCRMTKKKAHEDRNIGDITITSSQRARHLQTTRSIHALDQKKKPSIKGIIKYQSH